MLVLTYFSYLFDFKVIVQRALAAKNVSHAKAGCVLASYIKVLPLFILIMPGMVARIIFPGRSGNENILLKHQNDSLTFFQIGL